MQLLQCGRSTAARDRSGNIMPVGRGLNVMLWNRQSSCEYA
jgi:hypothetical protein